MTMTQTHEEKFVRLQVLQSLFEGQRMQALLQAVDIPTMLNSFGDTALDGLYQAQKGWGEIRVPESRKAEAEKIVEEHAPQITGIPEADLEKQALSADTEPAKITIPSSFMWILWVILSVITLLIAYFLLDLFY
jgi:hypothetical protein